MVFVQSTSFHPPPSEKKKHQKKEREGEGGDIPQTQKVDHYVYIHICMYKTFNQNISQQSPSGLYKV